MSNRWCPGTGQGTKTTMASVPLWASTALHSAVSLSDDRCLLSWSVRHFFVVCDKSCLLSERSCCLVVVGYVRLVGQEPAPSKCVLVSNSWNIKKDVRSWVLSEAGERSSVRFDVRDLTHL